MLFQFTTTKPPAVAVWKAIKKYPISAALGYTVFQIRFILYTSVMLSPDFKKTKDQINDYFKNESVLSILVNELEKYGISSILKIQYPPSNFPNFVEEELSAPYWMLYQLDVKISSTVWLELFSRESIKDKYEIEYLEASRASPIYLTEVNIWESPPSVNTLFRAFSIDETLPPVEIALKEDILNTLWKCMHQQLEILPIYNYSKSITIPPFILRKE